MAMESLIVVGLGPGDPGALTVEARTILESAAEVVVRTRRHPTVSALPAHLRVRSYDTLYRRLPTLAEVYRAIAQDVVKRAARPEGVIYGVPGHPLVAEESVREVIARARERGLSYRIVGGVSFLEPVFTALELDPLAQGLHIADATALAASYDRPDASQTGQRNPYMGTYRSFDATAPALVVQLHDRHVASLAKLVLLEMYPPEHEVALVRAAGVPGEEKVWRFPLYALDRQRAIDHLTCLYLPPLPRLEDLRSFETLRYITARLRGPGGCPWDREQTHASLKPYLVEETSEVLEALDLGDPRKLEEELGDLLLQIVLHAQLAIEADEFTLDDVIAGLSSKLIRRHPHVFGDREVADVGEVLRNWEAIKQRERASEAEEGIKPEPGALTGVAPLLPALAQSQSLQKRAARAGFDWRDEAGPLRKLREEVDEYAEAGDFERRREELGDLLFAAVGVARRAGIDAEESLRLANLRFMDRFHRMEAAARAEGKNLGDLAESELLARWRAAK